MFIVMEYVDRPSARCGEHSASIKPSIVGYRSPAPLSHVPDAHLRAVNGDLPPISSTARKVRLFGNELCGV
jgi:hypothetical protein